MKREDKLQKSHKIVFILTVVLVMNLTALLWFGWQSYSSYQESQITREQDSKAEELRGIILHLDEVLTMMARMAAATGDLKWEKRYREFEPKLDAAIKEAMAMFPEAHGSEAARKTDKANIILAEMENRAFDLIRQDQASEAGSVLFSNDYEKQKRIYAQGITVFAQSPHIYHRLDELRGNIIHLEEVLTMSARMAAVTGDLKWEKRYREFEPQLDAAIKEAIALSPAAHSDEAAARTDSANIKLVEMENQALDSVRHGNMNGAAAILFGDEYEQQKQIYANAMTDFTSGLSEAAMAEKEWQQRRTSLHTGIVILLIPLLIFTWFVIIRAAQRWRAMQIKHNQELTRQAEELAELNRSLDRKVVERTKDLEASRQTALQAKLEAEEARKRTEDTNETLKLEIIDRQRAEEQAAIFRQFADASGQGVGMGTLDGKITYVNPSLCRLLGEDKPEDVIGKAFVPYYPEELQQRLQNEIIPTVMERGQWVGEMMLKSKDGRLTPTLENFFLIRDEKGNPICLGDIMTDISVRKQAEDALSTSEYKYKTLLENIPQKIFSKDRDSVYLSCNENYARDLKIKSDEIPGKTDHDFFPKELADKYRADDRKIMEHGETEELDERYIEDDKEITVHTIKTPIRNEDGDITGILGLFWDITEQKRAEEALRESEEKYRGLVENIDIGISMISPQMEILSQNRKMQERFPTIDPCKKQLCYKVCNFSPGEETYSGCPVIKTLEDGEVHETVAEDPAGGEIRSYRIISSPIKDMSGNIVAAIEMVEDITEKLRVERELSRTDKLESIGMLAGGIAHDFNNLLAGFMGNISMAKMDIDPETKAYNALERAEDASVRAERLTLQLLTFAKGGAPVKELTSISELIEDTVSFALSGSNIKCDFQMPDDIWEVTVDKAQIGQAIQNLVQNAAQAMTDGGSIMISVENLLAESGGPVPHDEGKYVKISVKDRGVGIAEEHLQKIFEPYFTTREEGSGLGLPAVYSIVKNHAGHVDVNSEVGVGTTVNVYLPATEKEVSPEPAAEKKIISGKGKILVMDDEEMIRTMLEDMLEIIGYEVECASDGAEAIELFKSEKDSDQPFDVLIMDLTIPGGMGGKDAMARIREIDSEVKSIVSSGYSSDPVVANFRQYGFAGCLNKPYNTSQLSSVLDEVLTS